MEPKGKLMREYIPDTTTALIKTINVLSWVVYVLAWFYLPVVKTYAFFKKALWSMHMDCRLERAVAKDKVDFKLRRYTWR